VQLEGLGKLKKSISSGTRIGDLPACSIMPQPTTLPRTRVTVRGEKEIAVCFEKAVMDLQEVTFMLKAATFCGILRLWREILRY
jgi:hypothetical protein